MFTLKKKKRSQVNNFKVTQVKLLFKELEKEKQTKAKVTKEGGNNKNWSRGKWNGKYKNSKKSTRLRVDLFKRSTKLANPYLT